MTTSPLITRIQPRRPRGLKVLIHLDDGEPFEVTLEALERSRLGVGDALPAKARHQLLDMDEGVRVREAALNLLSYCPRTRTELARRLKKKGFHHARIVPCLDRLQERGFINDRAVAEAFIRDRIRLKPRGRSRLRSELRAKGVDGDTVEQVIEQVFADQEVSDVQLAEQVARGWVARQGRAMLDALGSDDRTARDKARRRLHGFLGRRGFGGHALSDAMRLVTELAKDA
ncbi:MAG: regulatory protein RecX [Gemmatimonadetes bacterium]|jgi:regulatory protein|nr:regulatory protein RecX [Gemmatimonadota bacterium]